MTTLVVLCFRGTLISQQPGTTAIATLLAPAILEFAPYPDAGDPTESLQNRGLWSCSPVRLNGTGFIVHCPSCSLKGATTIVFGCHPSHAMIIILENKNVSCFAPVRIPNCRCEKVRFLLPDGQNFFTSTVNIGDHSQRRISRCGFEPTDKTRIRPRVPSI